MAKKIKKIKIRNLAAVSAWTRGGAGSHGDAKKAKNKKACRGKVGGSHE